MIASYASLFVFVLCLLSILPFKADDSGDVGELRGWPAAVLLSLRILEDTS